MKTIVMVAKIIGIAILMITGSLLITLPINYLFYKVAGPIGKIIIMHIATKTDTIPRTKRIRKYFMKKPPFFWCAYDMKIY